MIDPLHGDGYQLWSGIGGAALIPVIFSAIQYAMPTRCSQLACRRRATMLHPLHGRPVCGKHMP